MHADRYGFEPARPISRMVVIAAGALVLSGCIGGFGAMLYVKTTEKPEPAKGHVAATFTTDEEGANFQFVLVSSAGKQYYLPFLGWPGDAQRVGMIAVEPGQYRLASWRSGRIAKHPLTRTPPSFTVEPGQVVFLGHFGARTELYTVGNLTTKKWFLDTKRIKADHASELLAATYPGFTEAAMECLLCDAPDP